MYIEYLYDTYKYEQTPYGRKLVTAYLITNCVDDAWFYTSKAQATSKIKEFPDYIWYEWKDLVYDSCFSELELTWRRVLKKVNDNYIFDDTINPWNMLEVAEHKNQWFSNRKFSSIEFAKEKFGNREYYTIDNIVIPKANNKEIEGSKSSYWIQFFLGQGHVQSESWLIKYKNKKHPNDDWTNVDLVTYAKYMHLFNDREVMDLIDEASVDGVLGYLD